MNCKMPTDEKTNLLAQNLETLRKSLMRLLFESEEPVVAAIKGGWGEGKTFFWKNSVAVSQANRKPGYVSVFRADSLAGIQREVILQAAASHDFGGESVVEKIGKSFPLFRRVGWLGRLVAREVPLQSLPAGIVLQLMERFVFRPGWVLCFDDIERLPANVELDALLGYIDSLREEKGLKVVLIYNDEKIGRKREKSLKRYTEKIVDREFRFSPAIGEILRLVLDEDTFGAELLEELERKCRVLSVRNIRILYRLKYYYREVVDVLPEGFDPRFSESIASSLLLFSWINFASGEALDLTLDYVESYSAVLTYMRRNSNGDAGESNNEDWREKLLEAFGYSQTDDLDNILMSFVRTSMLDKEALSNEYERYVTNTSRGKLEERLTHAWREHFHGTLANNEDEFCTALVEATEAYIELISLVELDSSLSVLSDLDRVDEAHHLFELYREKQPEVLEQVERSGTLGQVRFGPLREAVDEAEQAGSVDERSLGEVIESALSDEFVRRADREALAKFSAQDYVDYFIANDQPHLTGVMRHLARQTANQQDESDRLVHAAVTDAANTIAGMSQLNRLRMSYMGLISTGEQGEGQPEKVLTS